MTEHEWSACADPARLIFSFDGSATQRQLRLFTDIYVG